MLVRMLWVAPAEREIQPGDIVDHYNGEHLIAAGEAEKAPKGAKADKVVKAPAEPDAEPEAAAEGQAAEGQA